MADFYYCQCLAGVRASKMAIGIGLLICDEDIDECGSSPCLNQGVCSESNSDESIELDDYFCQCLPGYTHRIFFYQKKFYFS